MFFASINLHSQYHVLGVERSVQVSSGIYKFVGYGNSLTYGANGCQGTSCSYPGQLQTDMPSSTIINQGTNGIITATLIAQYQTNAAPYYSADTTSVITNWEGLNSLYNGWTTDSVQNQLMRLCQMSQATGFKVIIGTIPHIRYIGNNPAGNDSAYFNRQADTVNTWLRANYTGWADRIVNFDQNPYVNGSDLLFRDADGIHYTAAGYTLIFGMVKQELVTL